MKRETESYTVRKMSWVQVATQDTPPPVATPTVTLTLTVTGTATLPHADAALLTDLLRRHGFAVAMVLVVGSPEPTP
jgi:hypothetical protein